MDKSRAAGDEQSGQLPDADEQLRDELKLPDEQIADLEPDEPEAAQVAGGKKYSNIVL